MPRPLCTKITVVSIRPPDDSREVLYFTDELFFYPDSNLPDGPSAPHQKYIRGWVLSLPRKIYSDVLPTLP